MLFFAEPFMTKDRCSPIKETNNYNNCKLCDIILAPASGKWIKSFRSFAQRYVYRFGCTYRCEQSRLMQLNWSRSWIVKSKSRPRLTEYWFQLE